MARFRGGQQQYNKNRIVVFLEGGLGNQLFHYAFCHVLKEITKKDIYLDCTEYQNTDTNPRNLEIKYFDLNIKLITTNKELSKIIKVNFYFLLFKKFVNKINIKCFKKKIFYPVNKQKIIFYPHLHYKNIYELSFDIKNRIYIYGEYLWHFSNFIPFRYFFINTLYPKINLDSKNNMIYEKIKSSKNSCMIHVRRGDFVGIYELLDMDYYKMAMEIMREKYSDISFFVFGNDFDFMQENFIDDDCNVININNESKVIFDFVLMQSCKHKILANSTLSFWLGFLGSGDVIYKENISPSFTYSAKNLIVL